jgi:hypothetical protein
MSTTPEPEDPRAAEVGWFHALAGEVAAGDASIDSEVRTRLAQFLEVFLPESPLEGDETESELEEIIRDVRGNEIAWNRALGRAILEAHDAYEAGDPSRAVRVLEDFARECPWTWFAEMALNQSTHYPGGAR